MENLPTTSDIPSIGILRDFVSIRNAEAKIYPFETVESGLFDFFDEDNRCNTIGFKHAKIFYEIMVRQVNGEKPSSEDSTFIDDLIKIVKQVPKNPEIIGIRKEALSSLKRIKDRIVKAKTLKVTLQHSE